MTIPVRHRDRRRAIALLLFAVVTLLHAVLCVTRVDAQTARGSVAIFAPPGDTLRSVTPTFAVQATNFPSAGPFRVTLQIDTSARFIGPRDLDRTITTTDSSTTIAPVRALPEGRRIFYRAIVSDPTGETDTSAIAGPKISPPWVTPISPPNVVGQPVNTRTPKFSWRSPLVNSAPGPGPWSYILTITNLGQNIVTPVGTDTTFTPPFDLVPNAPYSWSIEARLTNEQRTIVTKEFTFIIEDPMTSVTSTQLYHNFPNPFPTAINERTCIWFDLKNSSSVSLDVYDLRGIHVRRLVPNPETGGVLAAGRYGRGRTEFNEGCDRRFAWDGTDDRGNVVPEGVYVIRFRGDGLELFSKALFLGRR